MGANQNSPRELGLYPKNNPSQPLGRSPRLHTPTSGVLALGVINDDKKHSGNKKETTETRDSQKPHKLHLTEPPPVVPIRTIGSAGWPRQCRCGVLRPTGSAGPGRRQCRSTLTEQEKLSRFCHIFSKTYSNEL